MLSGPQTETERIFQAKCLWLFLDYDGTLADFAPTPDDIFPDPEIIALLTRLHQHAKIRVAVVSGRRLDHLRALLPIPGLTLAGTYGVEILLPDGQVHHRLVVEDIRPFLDKLKPLWQDLIANRQGFYLEDKGWSLALHARFADDQKAGQLLAQAKELATSQINLNLFRILGGDKFLETSPQKANKGNTIQYLLEQYPAVECLPIYIGDDDKDEEAFQIIKQKGGIAIMVSEKPRISHAELRLPAPPTVLKWLQSLLIK
jgi:trehalose 6-phosphate phosphatase